MRCHHENAQAVLVLCLVLFTEASLQQNKCNGK